MIDENEMGGTWVFVRKFGKLKMNYSNSNQEIQTALDEFYRCSFFYLTDSFSDGT
ncbi:MAG: hypothetical protein OEZ34_16075 [Spirochaetia bacterium]|nr:hypothetical protein [Spirochaetia bacterium]